MKVDKSEGAFDESEKVALMTTLAFLAYTDSTIPSWKQKPWDVFKNLEENIYNIPGYTIKNECDFQENKSNTSGDSYQLKQKLVWGPAVGISNLRFIPKIADDAYSVFMQSNKLILNIARSRMFPGFFSFVENKRTMMMKNPVFKGYVSVSGKLAKQIMNVGIVSDININQAELFSKAFMFITESQLEHKETEHPKYTPEYTVSIRGANPFSFPSLLRAFDISKQVLWNHDKILEGNTDPMDKENYREEICISRGSARAIKDHLTMKPKPGFRNSNVSMVEFLKDQVRKNDSKTTINITGHSLGGIISPAIALWLYEEFASMGCKDKVDINAYCFGCPTPGNKGFIKYIDRVFGARCICFNNELDPCTQQFDQRGIKRLPDLYDDYDIKPDPFVSEYTSIMTSLSDNTNYAHLTNYKSVPPIYILKSSKSYMNQAIFQHVFPYIDYIESLKNMDNDVKEKWLKMVPHLYEIANELYESYVAVYPFL